MDGTTLKNWREMHGITQDALANRLGVTSTSIGNFESGRSHQMKPKNMRKLAAILREDPAVYEVRSNPSPEIPKFCFALADEIKALADLMISKEFSGQFKAEKFRSAITSYHDHLDDYLAALHRIDSNQ